MYVCMYVLGGGCLIERVKRWLASCRAERDSCVGKRVRPIAGRTCNLPVFLFASAFACRTGICERVWHAQATQQHKNGADENRKLRTKAVPKSFENFRQIVQLSMKKPPKSPKNLRKFALGPFWAPKAVSGTCRDVPWPPTGRPNVAPRPLLGCPGRGKCTP